VGSGTGILIPKTKKYKPGSIYACDLSRRILEQLKKNYPYVKTIMADVRELFKRQISNFTPTSMTRSAGRLKNEVTSAALRNIKMKRFARHRAIELFSPMARFSRLM
jgi:hypothetical protein